jgi:hypothetical protein
VSRYNHLHQRLARILKAEGLEGLYRDISSSLISFQTVPVPCTSGPCLPACVFKRGEALCSPCEPQAVWCSLESPSPEGLGATLSCLACSNFVYFYVYSGIKLALEARRRCATPNPSVPLKVKR